MRDTRDKLVVIFLFSLFVNLFLFHAFGSLGVGLFLIGLWALGIGLFGDFRRLWSDKTQRYATLLTAASALSLLFVDGPLRSMLIVLGTLAGYASTTYILLRGYTPRGIWESFSAWFQVPGEYAKSLLAFLSGGRDKRTFLALKPKKSSSSLRSLLIGLAIGLPILIWMTSLLSNADPVFAHYVQTIFSKEFLQRVPIRLFVMGFVFVALLPTLGMRFLRPFLSPAGFFVRLEWKTEISVVLAMIAGVLGLFLAVQWPYIFAHVAEETSLSQFGVATYSDYVQKGFAELVKVAFIVFGVSWISYLIARGKEVSRLQMSLQSIVGAEFIVFVASIIRRVTLYTHYHGLSLARLYGLAFLIWLLGMCTILACRFITRRTLARYEVTWTILAWVLTIAINMQALVVRNPPTVNNRIDYVYLARLSADGQTGWDDAYTWATTVIDRVVTQPGLIGPEDRRDLYYARLVLINLRDRYVDYAEVYDPPRGQSTQAFDRLLRWNVRQYQGYQDLRRFTDETQLESYLSLADELSRRIDRQPVGEREINLDISFETPLL